VVCTKTDLRSRQGEQGRQWCSNPHSERKYTQDPGLQLLHLLSWSKGAENNTQGHSVWYYKKHRLYKSKLKTDTINWIHRLYKRIVLTLYSKHKNKDIGYLTLIYSTNVHYAIQNATKCLNSFWCTLSVNPHALNIY
jgi:hypothetical protein